MMERETFIQQSVKEKPHLFVSKIFKMFHEPLTDAYLNKEEGRIAYVNEYFNNLDFNDEELINTTIYTDKVIHYIQSYGQYGLSREQQENEFIKAVDIVIGHVNKNQVVYEFILDYIVRGFENLNLKKALAHIAEVYGETTCQTDEKTTLERRLGAQKMLAGTQVLDFTLNDINGDPITLSEIAKEKTLIVFWASWCPHCNELIPEIKTWEEQLNSEIVEVIAVSIDSIKLDWQNQVFKSGIESWYNLSDLKGWDGKVTEQYNVYATPIMLLIDKNLTILSKPENLFELKTALE